ncbi:MAG: hypothetical protein JNM63_19980, partial [Spirochaetia bacterium]|nr:hypothetical protein [Spirochaetia bacterium]
MNDSPSFFRAFIKTFAPVAILAFFQVHAANVIPKKFSHPQIAATPEEIARLKKAWLETGANHDIVAGLVSGAAASLDKPIEFPPRGGQHGQWYQCTKCQLGLVTVDATHHRCPKCGEVYSGEPYDDVIFGKVHGENLRTANNAAWAYSVTGEKKYADLAISILSGYADRYLDYPFHDANRKQSRSGAHLFAQTLDEAYSSYNSIGPTFDLVEPA